MTQSHLKTITTIKKNLFYIALAPLMTACDKGNDGPDFPGPDPVRTQFVLNGTTWAQQNVAERGYFAAAAEDYGDYYDFEVAQNVCPNGWRTPTQRDWAALLSLDCAWTSVNGIKGLSFRRGEATLFLPAAGSVHRNGVAEQVGTDGFYWSATPSKAGEEQTGWSARIGVYADGKIFTDINDDYLQWAGFSVRCVKD